ncbi:MAG: DUF455 family protein [Zetaproteobacteria bacterium]|nr:MAG: DUF455 family protein [Zetaproteobacteria bacterium]
MGQEARTLAWEAFVACDPDRSCALARRAAQAAEEGNIDPDRRFADLRPGWPEGLRFVRPALLPKRGFHTRAKHRALVHAIAHIEYSAIKLALDAAVRYAGLPLAFYQDWLRIAAEEAYHFELIRAHLRHLGGEYGELPVHGELWHAAERTKDDLLARLAVVPRVLEARGLDVNPKLQDEARAAGDEHLADLLSIIFRDEIGHVRAGSRWFHRLCAQKGLNPAQTWQELVVRYFLGRLPPGDAALRAEAGFLPEEVAAFQALTGEG